MRRLLAAPKASFLQARTFTSLRLHYNYRLYFSGQFLSQTGTWLQNAAMAWLVLEMTHSAFAVGVLTFWQFGPYVVLGLFGGALSDRFDHRRTLVYTQTGLALCSTLAAVLTLSHMVTLWEMYAIAATRGLILVLNNPSQQAFLFQMVGRKELPNAIALNSSVINATRILGPGLGGLLIAAFGVGICFSIDAVSYGAVIVALLLMHVQELLPIERRVKQSTFLREVGEGLRFVRQTPTVLVALSIFLLICLVSVNFTVLLPLVASDTLHSGADVFGFLTAIFGAGAMIGALISASVGRGSWPILLVSAAGFGISEGVLAVQHTVIGALALLLFTGIFFTLYTSNTNTLVQLSTPGYLQGRVVGLYSYIFAGTNSLGALVAGGLAAIGGTALAFLVAGATALACAVFGTIAMRNRLTLPPSVGGKQTEATAPPPASA